MANVPELSEEQAGEISFWFHLAATPKLNRLNNHFYSSFLRDKHRLNYTKDLIAFIACFPNNHINTNRCQCNICNED